MNAPSIQIIFKQTAAATIQRGSRGIVALILKDSVHNGMLYMNDITDMPSNLSTYNKKQISDAWVGNTNIPIKVIAFIEASDATDYTAAMTALEAEHWDYLAIPGIVSGDVTTISTWIKGLRDNKGYKVKAVLPNAVADHEGIINFATDNIVVGETTYDVADYCARIAGLIAGTPLNQSATYAVLSEVTDVPHMTKADFDTAVNAGKFVLMNDGKKVKVVRAVNSLTTLTDTKGSDYQKIKLVDIMDQISSDVNLTVADNYIGKYANDYANKCLLITAINAYFAALNGSNLIDNGYSVGIDIDAQIAYLKAQSVDTTTMTAQQIKEANTGSEVLLAGNIKILDAIEDFTFNIGI